MATGGEQDQPSELSCSICFEQYRIPKILQCSHVYCHLCLNSLALDKPGGFDCPICRQTVDVTPGGVEALPTYSSIGRSRETTSALIFGCGKTKQNINFAKTSVTAPREDTPTKSSFDRNILPPLVCGIKFTTNSQSSLLSLTLSAENKLWVVYRPPFNISPFLCVYDTKERKLLGKFINESLEGCSLTCLGDRLLSPLTWQWIDTDGKSGNLEISPNKWALCSKSLPPHIVLQAPAPANQKVVVTVHCLQQQSADPAVVSMTPVITDGLTFDQDPTAFDISTDRKWVAFLVYPNVHVFYTDCKSAKAFSSVHHGGSITDITFTTRDGGVVLAAAFSDRIHIYDFQEGFTRLACLHSNFCLFYRLLTAQNDGVIWYEAEKGWLTVKSVESAPLCNNCKC